MCLKGTVFTFQTPMFPQNGLDKLKTFQALAIKAGDSPPVGRRVPSIMKCIMGLRGAGESLDAVTQFTTVVKICFVKNPFDLA